MGTRAGGRLAAVAAAALIALAITAVGAFAALGRRHLPGYVAAFDDDAVVNLARDTVSGRLSPVPAG